MATVVGGVKETLRFSCKLKGMSFATSTWMPSEQQLTNFMASDDWTYQHFGYRVCCILVLVSVHVMRLLRLLDPSFRSMSVNAINPLLCMGMNVMVDGSTTNALLVASRTFRDIISGGWLQGARVPPTFSLA